jgi:hypothetical protein
VAHHFVRERVAREEIKVLSCPTQDMLPDLFTKVLSKPKHEVALAWWMCWVWMKGCDSCQGRCGD